MKGIARVIFPAIGVPIGYLWLNTIVNSFKQLHKDFKIAYQSYLDKIYNMMSLKVTYIFVISIILLIIIMD